MADCNKELMEQFGYTAKAAEAVLDEVRQSGPTADDWIRYANERQSKTAREKKLREFNAKANAVRMLDAQSHVASFKDKFTTWEGLKSFFLGSDARIDNAQSSVHNAMRERVETLGQSVTRDLRKAAGEDVFGWLADPEFVKEAGKWKWELANHRETVKFEDSKKLWGSKAWEVAKVYDKYHELGRQGLNHAGADVGDLANYVMPQTHDPAKLLKAGKEAWVKAILPLLDQDKTFRTSSQGSLSVRTDAAEPLGQIWKKITDGDWGSYADDRLTGTTLASRLSRSRELHFKDFESFDAYNTRYGKGSLVEGMQHHAENQQRNIALMEKMGTNPKGFAKKLIGSFGTDARPPGTKLGPVTIPSIKPSAEIMAKTLLGLDSVPGDPRWADFFQLIRQVQDTAHLGSSLASQIPDIAAIGARAQFNGMSWLSSHGDSMAAFLRGRPKGEWRDIGEAWSIYADGVLGHVNQRFSAFDSPDGVRSKMVENFYKLAGVKRWDDSQRVGFGYFMLHNLTQEIDRGRSFDKLDPHLQDNLSRYGIKADDWSKLTKDMVKPLEDGRRMLDSDTVPKDVAQKLRTMFVTESTNALPLPGPYERAFMLRGSQPGTYTGELARFFARYKGVSITMGTRVLPEVWKTGKVGAISAFMVESAALGYLAFTARELMQGRTPPDPTHPSTIAQSIVKGGGAGYAGDLFISMGEDMNKSAMDVLSGVSGGTASNVWRIGQQIIDEVRNPEKKHDIGTKVFNLVQSETPFVNLFYAKLAINYLFANQVREALNPGTLRRSEERVKRETGNQYFIPRSLGGS